MRRDQIAGLAALLRCKFDSVEIIKSKPMCPQHPQNEAATCPECIAELIKDLQRKEKV